MTQVLSLLSAIDNFVRGCKADGNFNAIKSSCILAAWNNLNGALVPLVGTAPTNFNFVSGDYNRKTGLVGDKSTKYLSSNRLTNHDPQNNRHFSTYASTLPTTGTAQVYVGSVDAVNTSTGGDQIISGTSPNQNKLLSRCATNTTPDGTKISVGDLNAIGFIAIARNNGSDYVIRGNKISETITVPSSVPNTQTAFIFSRNLNGSFDSALATEARLAFYSIGESLNLAQLDARVTTLINDIGAAIP